MMSNEPGSTPSEPEELQFDHAEFDHVLAPTAVACASCRKPIDDHYFEVNGTILCEPCRYGVEEQIRGGSKLGRFGRAALFGSLAAVVGTIVYTTFRILSPVDISLVAIGVGYIVGKMVRKGSRNLGGLPYQLLAVFLTYTSLAMTYFFWMIFMVIQAKDAGQLPPKPAVAAKAEIEGQAKVPPAPPAQPGPAAAAGGPQAVDILAMLGLAFAMPFLMIKLSPIMIAFVGFALWQAWTFNAPLQIRFNGPYLVGDPDSSPQGVPGHA